MRFKNHKSGCINVTDKYECFFFLYVCGLPAVSPTRLVPVGEMDMESIDWVNDGHCLHAGICLCGQRPLGCGQQLHAECFEHEQGKFASDAPTDATSEWHVAEPTGFAFIPVRGEALRVKQLWACVGRRSLVRVTDAVHDAPPFGDLVTL